MDIYSQLEKRICVGATSGSGLAIHGADAVNSENIVVSWAKRELGL